MATYVNIRRLTSNLLTIGGIAISNSLTGTQIDIDSSGVKSDLLKYIGAYASVDNNLLASRASLRRQKLLQAMGLITETCQRGVFSTGTAETNQRMVGNPVYLFDDDPAITGIVVACTVAGAGQTLVKLALYNLAGAIKAQTVDVKADFTVAGDRPEPFITPLTSHPEGVYIPVFLGVGGTQPTLGRMAGGASSGGGPFGTGTVKVGYQQTGLSDLPSTATFTAANVLYWMGLY